MEIKILACHLTCIIFRGPSCENGNLNFVCHLTKIFIKCMFSTGKMAFDEHDTRQMFAMVWSRNNISIFGRVLYFVVS